MAPKSFEVVRKFLFSYEKSELNDVEEVRFKKIHFSEVNPPELCDLVVAVVDIVLKL
jgi:hypothetical protein